ncbi:MAG: hypothetical protein QGG42_14640 [Phycisphaerae bacterium]|jgi:hypothetical protein|nr:hypothetical protein [Phycisphaerae bacterium]
MMRKPAIVLLLAVSLLVGACGKFSLFGRPAKPPVSESIETNTVKNGPLALTIELPKRRFAAGEDISLRIIAHNTGKQAIAFESSTSALYKVTLYRMTSSGWRWVNQYPQSVMSVRKTWKLQPGQSVKYSQIITVGRDWPMDEALKMVVELVGAPDLKCPMIISATAK